MGKVADEVLAVYEPYRPTINGVPKLCQKNDTIPQKTAENYDR